MVLPKIMVALVMLTTIPLVLAETAEEKGLKIFKEQEKRDRSWHDSTANMKMILINRKGKETIRDVRILSLEVTGDGDKSLTIFDNPRDVKGTAILTYSHALKPDEQWIYLPAIKRVKRIASKNKSGPFMGSEFSFEDLTSFEVEEYAYKYIKSEACPTDDKLSCFVVEAYPKDEYSGYTKQVIWLDDQEYRTHFIEFYDRKNSLLKTLHNSEFTLYKRKYWRPSKSLMINLQTKKKTLLQFEKVRFRTGLKDKDFSQNSLKRTK